MCMTVITVTYYSLLVLLLGWFFSSRETDDQLGCFYDTLFLYSSVEVPYFLSTN